MMGFSIKTAKSGARANQDQALLFEIIYRLVVFIQAHPPASRDLSADRNGVIADRAKRYLDSNIHRTISVEEVAGKLGFSHVTYFTNRFHEFHGISPTSARRAPPG